MGIKKDKKKKEKIINLIEEEEQKQININKKLQRDLMGAKERKFMTQKEENEERLKREEEIKKSMLSMEQCLQIPFINSIRLNNLDKYKSFHPRLNDIYKNVLDFNFYNMDRPTEEIPNTFENEAHYRYVWIIDFFNELKYCLLNEKIENSEVQNYENADVKIDIIKVNDIDNDLSVFKVNANKKLYELKRKILKDNDIIAIYNENSTFDKNQITLKNENFLNYFLGIVTRDYDSNDLSLYVLRNYYKTYIQNDMANKDEDNFSMFNKKIKYLGSINSSLREYKALFDLELSNFTGIIKTETIFMNSSIENLSKKQIININPLNYYLSDKELFLKNLQTSSLFNEPQKNAIYQANNMKKNEILLIQGPPGTGKTHTILGLISMLLKNGRNSKILVCAPSNAAIDEISARLAVQGIYNCDLKKDKCKFLRFGLYDRKDKEKRYLETFNGKILEKYSLEFLSDQKYKKDFDNINERLENLRKQLNNYNREKEKEKDNVKYNNILGSIKNTETSISNCLKLLSDKKYQRNLFEHDVLVSTPILCTTLNNAGNERLKRARLSYEYLIVDEASQCVEPLSLIPLCHDVKKLILVGDHMQLPATVFYPKASKILYNRSLFERLIDNKYPRFILTVQYRMQKNISEFISKTFYENKLSNDENHVEKINKELMYDIIKIENNFSFFDVKYGEELLEEDKKSYINEKEIKFSFYLIKKIINEILKKIDFYRNERDKKKKENKPENNKNEIEVVSEEDEKIRTLRNYKFAIICTYKAQVMKFREMKRRDKFFWDRKLNDIEINTVDSFQGQERDIVIFSTVRANFKDESMALEDGEIPGSEQSPKQTDTDSNEKTNNNNIGIGFLNDFRRMNVGLSRAKVGCFIVGHYETLKNNNYWMKLMNFCKDKNSFFQVENHKEFDAIKNVFVP
jgi:superfamily I DNA and/or RNA helicase